MEVNKETKEVIVRQEIQAFMNTQYQLSLRYKVQKVIGNANDLQLIEQDMLKVERAIDILQKELESI